MVVVTTAVVTSICVAPSMLGATGGSQPVGPQNLTSALAAIENGSRYAQSTWGYEALDQTTGNVLASQNASSMFDPGSTMKIYSTATALRLYGPNYRFTTPVYREGAVSNGVLNNGNLVLVGSGDLSLGLRDEPNGTMYYESTPALDQSYANVGLPGAVEPPGNPFAGLDQIAAQVRASGITEVSSTSNVIVDDSLFNSYNGFPDGNISPIWFNENLVDALVTPGAVNGPASVSWRPTTAQYTVSDDVTTVAEGGSTTLQIKETTPGALQVQGTIAAGTTPTLAVYEVDDPAAFARSAFIEALQQAGVKVDAPAGGPNPALPNQAGLQVPANLVGKYVSLPLSQFINLILKVSYNRGADLMTCLAAVKMGSTDCGQGLASELTTITGLGIPAQSVFPLDGAGSDDQGRTTVDALAQFLRRIAPTSYGSTMYQSLPVLGRNGTVANVLTNSPAAGHVELKTGNRAVGSSDTNLLMLLGNSLAGYIQTRSGHHVTFMIVVGNVPLTSAQDVLTVTDEQAQMVAVMYQDL